MTRGRKPKPLDLHLVDGTFNATRHGDRREARRRARRATEARIPSPPAWLPPAGKSEWRRVAKLLHDRGALERIDRSAFAVYCRAWAELRGAQQTLETEGRTFVTDKGNVIQHPAVGQANVAAKQVLAAAAEFGMTPSARTRLAGGAGMVEDDDSLEAFRKRRRGSS